jgi:DNA-binding FadR family transcriptional regulator
MPLSTNKISRIEASNTIVKIVDSLHEHIIGGKLAPGTVLTAERELAKDLGVSRFSLREALRIAEAQGLINIQRGRRPRVAEPSASAAAEVLRIALRRTKKTLVQLTFAREVLECQVVRLAAEWISEPEFALLEESITAMESNKDNHAVCIAEDMKFHNVLLKASRQVVFEMMLLSVAPLLKESRIKTFKRVGAARAIEGHRLILSCLKRHDATGAVNAMHAHLEMAKEDLSD